MATSKDVDLLFHAPWQRFLAVFFPVVILACLCPCPLLTPLCLCLQDFARDHEGGSAVFLEVIFAFGAFVVGFLIVVLTVF